jgi:hypothetical protein
LLPDIAFPIIDAAGFYPQPVFIHRRKVVREDRWSDTVVGFGFFALCGGKSRLSFS